MGSVQVKALQTTVQEKDLISSVTNSSDGKLTIKFTIPANTTVNYSYYAFDIIGGRKYTFDKKSSTISNTSNQKVTKSVTVSVNYYGKYEVHATRSNNYIWDTYTITSALKTTKYTSKFVWDANAIKDDKSGQRVNIVCTYAFSTLCDIIATKGAMSAILTFTSLATVNSGSSTYTVDKEPIAGWGWKYKFVPASTGIKQYLMVYNESGSLYKTYSQGELSYSSDHVRR